MIHSGSRACLGWPHRLELIRLPLQQVAARREAVAKLGDPSLVAVRLGGSRHWFIRRRQQRPRGRESSLNFHLIESQESHRPTGFEADDQQPCARGRRRRDFLDVKVAIAVVHAVQAAVVHDQLEVRADPGLTQMRDVGLDKVDRNIGGAGLGPGLVERLRHEVNPGDVPSVLGKVDRRVPGATSDVERRPWWQRGFVSGSLDEFPQTRHQRMTVPGTKPESVENPKQCVSRSHSLTVCLGRRRLKRPKVGR